MELSNDTRNIVLVVLGLAVLYLLFAFSGNGGNFGNRLVAWWQNLSSVWKLVLLLLFVALMFYLFWRKY